MRLTPTDEQEALREAVRRVLDETQGFDRRRALVEAGETRDPEAWAGFAELGFLGVPFAEDLGGLGGGPVEVALVAEEMGRAAVLDRWAATVVLAGGLIDRLGDADQKAALLDPLIAGAARPALAHLEPGSGDRLMAVEARAEETADGFRLAGRKTAVLGGDAADSFLVTARIGAGLGVFVVPSGDAGLTVSPYAMIDGGAAADLAFDLALPASALLGGNRDAGPAIEATLDAMNAAQCADAVGAMSALLEATLAYTKERAQFGQPLAKFQALRHRMAEMAVMLEEARASALLATLSVAADPAARRRGVSGARARIGQLSRKLAQEAVQLHGAMGFSEEMPVATWFRRLYAFENTLGSTDLHLARYGDEAVRPEVVSGSLLRADGQEDGGQEDGGGQGDDTLNLSMSPEDVAFRDRVRAFLAEGLDEGMRRAERLNPSFLAEAEIGLARQRQVAPSGWVAPSWPVEHGGPGFTLAQRYIFDQECELAGEPHFRGAGIKMLAPVLMRFGTPAQQERYLPAILSGADLWAQGYSEPGSGSDLASLRTRALRDGDHYVVNGSKIWTTLAHHATRCFALVRTDDSGRKQQGITFLLIDLRQPGVEIRPILSMDGTHEFNQVFFDDVRVPVADRVGDEGEGWTIAKYLLEFERGGSFAGGQLRALFARLHRIASAPGPGGRAALDDPLQRARFAELGTRIDANDILELVSMARAQAGGAPGATAASVMKIERSRIRQDITQMSAALLGPDALRWDRQRPLHAAPPEDPLAEERKVAPALYLNARSQSIFGGSNEIQLELIARALLG